MRAIDRAFAVVGSFSLDHPNLTLQQIADRIGLAKSTTFRLVSALVDLGYLVRGQDLRYSLTAEFGRLAEIAAHSVDARRVLRPVMEKLVAETGENVTLNTVDGRDRVCVEVARSSSSPIFTVNHPGERTPLGLGGASLVLMAFMPEPDLNLVIRPAARTVKCSARELRSILQTVQQQGYAVSHGGGIRGLSGISTPVFESDGRVRYCLTVVVPTKRVAGHVSDLLAATRRAGVEASRRIGGVLGVGHAGAPTS